MIRILALCLLVLTVQSKMLYAAAFIRHGSSYPKNDLYDGSTFGALQGKQTSVGMRQQYLLGSYLKHDYITEERLTTPKSNPKQVEIFSTSSSRTTSSSLSLLFGLFPLEEGWTIPQEVPSDKLIPPFQPLSINQLTMDDNVEVNHQDVEDNNEDALSPQSIPFALTKGYQAFPVFTLDQVFDNCPNYGTLMTNRYQQTASQMTKFQGLHSVQIAKLKLLFNLSALQTTVPTMAALYDTIQADLSINRPMPKDYNQYDHKSLRFISSWHNSVLFSGTFGSILSTPSLRMLRRNLQAASTASTTKKLSIYECHQSNIWPLLTVLNLTSTTCLQEQWKEQPISALNCMTAPDFSSNLIFQLHEDDSFNHFVKVRYNGEYVYLCESKQLMCRLEDFIARVKQAETDFQKQCKVTTNQKEIEIQ